MILTNNVNARDPVGSKNISVIDLKQLQSRAVLHHFTKKIFKAL